MIAILGTSDQPCWLAEACKVMFFFFNMHSFTVISTHTCGPLMLVMPVAATLCVLADKRRSRRISQQPDEVIAQIDSCFMGCP